MVDLRTAVALGVCAASGGAWAAPWTVVSEAVIAPAGGSQHHATTTFLDDGTNVLTWHRYPGFVYAQAFDSQHQPFGVPVWLDTTDSQASRPDVQGEGTAYVAYNSRNDVFLLRLSDVGLPDLSVQVNQTAGDIPGRGLPDLALAADGSVVVVWEANWANQIPKARYFVRRFGPDLVPVGPEQAFASSDLFGTGPDVAPLPDGGFVAAWAEKNQALSEIVLGWFDAGDALVHRTRVDQDEVVAPGASRPNVATNDAGAVAVAWKVSWGGLGRGAWARLYGTDQLPVGPPVVLAAQPDHGDNATVALVDDAAVFAWNEGLTPQVFVQAFHAPTGLTRTQPTQLTPPAARGAHPALAMQRAGADRHDVVVTFTRETQVRRVGRIGLELELPPIGWR